MCKVDFGELTKIKWLASTNYRTVVRVSFDELTFSIAQLFLLSSPMICPLHHHRDHNGCRALQTAHKQHAAFISIHERCVHFVYSLLYCSVCSYIKRCSLRVLQMLLLVRFTTSLIAKREQWVQLVRMLALQRRSCPGSH